MQNNDAYWIFTFGLFKSDKINDINFSIEVNSFIYAIISATEIYAIYLYFQSCSEE